jgi:WD40 repeat protein
LVTSVVFSPDGQMLATAGVDGVVTLWRVSKGELQRFATLAGHTGVVNDAAFSPDGRTIATAGSDGTLRLWNASLFRELITFKEAKGSGSDVPEFLRGSENHVSAVAFSHDGKFLVTGLIDGTVRFRRAATDAQVAARD